MQEYVFKIFVIYRIVLLIIMLFANNTTTNLTITIENYRYNPQTVTVPIGKTISWINNHNIPHTVTDVDMSHDSGIMEKGDKYSHTYNKVGTYNYYCRLHPTMKGTINVI